MKGCDIEVVLSVNPAARFALKKPRATKVTELRNLVSASAGKWDCEVHTSKGWLGDCIPSRLVCTVEDATRSATELVARNKAHYVTKKQAENTAQRLRAIKVDAKAVGLRVLVHDLDGMDRVLDCVSSQLKLAARLGSRAGTPLVTGKPHKL